MRPLKAILVTIFYGIAVLSCKKEAVVKPTVDLPKAGPHLLILSPDKISDNVVGYLTALPSLYDSTNEDHPLLIFFHGGGQLGDGSFTKLSLLFQSGLPKVLAEKKFPPYFKVRGMNHSFVILTPQFSVYPTLHDLEVFIDFAKKNYRVDTNRIYISGLSMGGILTADVGGLLTNRMAAIVPIGGISWEAVETKCQNIAVGNLPVWVFHNKHDPQINAEEAIYFVNKINSFNPAIKARLTLFEDNKHDAWTKATDPFYKEGGMNIYEWMLQYSK